MGIPDNNSDTASKTKSFEQTVNEAVDTLVQNDKGVWEFPADVKESMSEEVRFAATAVKRYKDTQGMFTRSQQGLKAVEAEKALLTEELSKYASKTIELTQEQTEELADLKITDAEAYRQKMNTYEQEATQKLADTLSATSAAASEASEIERRRLVLSTFNEEHGVEITEDTLNNEVPPRITKKLAEGKVTFEEYLVEVKNYIETPKTTKQEEIKEQPNLNNVGGGSTASKAAAKKDIVESYGSTIF